MIAARIVVSPDEDQWHWVAYDNAGEPIAACGAESNDERAIRRAAEELGCVVEDAEFIVESRNYGA